MDIVWLASGMMPEEKEVLKRELTRLSIKVDIDQYAQLDSIQ